MIYFNKMSQPGGPQEASLKGKKKAYHARSSKTYFSIISSQCYYPIISNSGTLNFFK